MRFDGFCSVLSRRPPGVSWRSFHDKNYSFAPARPNAGLPADKTEDAATKDVTPIPQLHIFAGEQVPRRLAELSRVRQHRHAG
jgi:hypothetical protein